MLKSLRGRNIALMAAVLFAGQALTMALVALLVIWPQADRVAGILARNVRMVATTFDALPPAERAAFVERINASGSFRLRAGTGEPPGSDGRPTWLETTVLRALAEDLDQEQRMVWRGGGGQPLWVRLELGRQGYYWLSLAPSPGWTPNGALLGAFLVGLALSLFGGLALQRRINRPLRQLGEAIDAMPDTARVKSLSEGGPAEIANVARAFDRMAARLAAQDADRAFMLAGISHDLKTPIAKLRLATSMAQPDGEHSEIIERQFDRLDAMLGQFLDFGRGSDAEAVSRIDIEARVKAVITMLGIGQAATVTSDTTRLAVAVRPIAFDRVITNLLRNAMHHGRAPYGVAIARNGPEVAVTVSDSGGGAPSYLLERLGQPFLRGDPSRPSDGGVGLGLAIAARFAADHGGTITFANRAGGGFEAVLTLPVATPV